LETALRGKVAIGDISWGFSNGVWIDVEDVSVVGSTVMPVDFKLPRLYAKVSIPPLLKRKIALTHLRLESPEAEVRLAPGGREPSQQPVPQPDGTKPAGIALPIAIEEVRVTNGKIRLRDSLTLPAQPMVREFVDVAIKANNLAPGREVLFDLSMKDDSAAGLGLLEAQGSFTGLTDSLTLQNPKLTVHATLSALHTECWQPGISVFNRRVLP
jgi:hypothetical protein